jgi:ketosteroid isomerase-like protein
LRSSWLLSISAFVVGSVGLLAPTRAPQPEQGDEQQVAALDVKYQAAVKVNDAAVMGALLADDFALVTGDGGVQTKADLLNEARSKQYMYAHQEDTSRTVRVWGNTAVVTALLWGKGTHNGKPFDYRVWFSDTYARTPTGWRYVFGQASFPLPGR